MEGVSGLTGVRRQTPPPPPTRCLAYAFFPRMAFIGDSKLFPTPSLAWLSLGIAQSL